MATIVFKNGQENPWDATLYNKPVPRLHDSNVCRGLVTKIILGQHLSHCFRDLLIRRSLLFPLHLCSSGTFISRIFSHFFYNINKMAFTVITMIKTLQY